MTILITGGTGLVGTRLLPRLVEAGFDCRALVRAGKSVPAGVTAVEGDILHASSLAAAMDASMPFCTSPPSCVPRSPSRYGPSMLKAHAI